jgi:hypothetical protein
MANEFFFEQMVGTLKKGKSRRAFQDAMDKLLARFCGKDWEYRYPDEGLWGD